MFQLFETRGLSSTTSNSKASSAASSNALLPGRPPVLARHLLHITDTALDLDIHARPLANVRASYDDWGWEAASAAMYERDIHLSSVLAESEAEKGGEDLHRRIVGPKENDDATNILGSSALPTGYRVLLSGLTEAKSSKKRSAGEDGDAAAKRLKGDGRLDSMPGRGQLPSGAQVGKVGQPLPGTGQAPAGLVKPDQTQINKVLFLQQQQAMMLRNLAIAAKQSANAQSGEDASSAPPMQRQYLEQLKNQLIAQQNALRLQAQQLTSGKGPPPNFNLSLHSLVNIDKEAREMGVNLGGPSTLEQQRQQTAPGQQARPPQQTSSVAPGTQVLNAQAAGVAAQAGDGLAAAAQTQQQQVQQAQQAIIGQPPTAGPGATTARPPTAPATGGGKPFWTGGISWSINDPNTKQKRDIATLVMASAAPNAHLQDL